MPGKPICVARPAPSMTGRRPQPWPKGSDSRWGIQRKGGSQSIAEHTAITADVLVVYAPRGVGAMHGDARTLPDGVDRRHAQHGRPSVEHDLRCHAGSSLDCCPACTRCRSPRVRSQRPCGAAALVPLAWDARRWPVRTTCQMLSTLSRTGRACGNQRQTGVWRRSDGRSRR